MKKIGLLMLGIVFLLSSCAIHNQLTSNVNNHSTEVVLSKKNFKVVETVKGESQALYVFGIGGHKKDAMINEARTNMLINANIIGSPKAIIYETVETKSSLFPIVRLYKVIVSGYVVEFTE